MHIAILNADYWRVGVNIEVFLQAQSQAPHQSRRVHQHITRRENTFLVILCAQFLRQFTTLQTLIRKIAFFQCVFKRIQTRNILIFPRHHEFASLMPQTIDAVFLHALKQTRDGKLIQCIQLKIFGLAVLLGIHIVWQINDKARIAPRSTLPHIQSLDHSNFLVWIQLLQTLSRSQARKPSTNDGNVCRLLAF